MTGMPEPGDPGGLFDDCPVGKEGNEPSSGNNLILLYRGVIMQGRAHHLSQHIEAKERFLIDFEKTIMVGKNRNFPFHRLGRCSGAFSDERVGHDPRRFILVDLMRFQFNHIDMFFAESLQMFNILLL